MNTSFLRVAVGLLLAAVACNERAPADFPEGIQQRVVMTPFTTCAELEAYIEDVAVRQMAKRLDDVGVRWGGGLDAAASADAGGPGPGPTDYTETNVQEQGVDEPDFVKNDGTRIFVLSGETVHAMRSWPPESLALISSLKLEGRPTSMFRYKDQLVIFGAVYSTAIKTRGTCMGSYCPSYGNATKVTIVDVTKLDAPKVVREHYLPGYYKGARRVGSAVRLVLRDSLRWPAGIKWYLDYRPYDPRDDASRLTALSALKASNERIIRAASLADWLPKAQRRDTTTGATVDVAYACADFMRSNAPVRLGLASVVTLDLDAPKREPTRTTIVGEVDEIYASQKALYLASRHWWWGSRGGSDHTYLHKFDTTDAYRARHVASGGVEGYGLDQFAMDEHRGYLRIATTVRQPALDGGWRTTTVNRVSVLREHAGQLEVVGRTKDLAKGERIYAVRLQGDRGYVVTFRQVDPLFTLNLANPKAPVVVGELKVPGFSTYLHPIGDNHLLGIGVHVPAPGSGLNPWQRNVKLSVFDVSDFTKPREQTTKLIGTTRGRSEATSEHKAFNYFAKPKLLAIPFNDREPYGTANYWSGFVSDLRVYHIDVAKGITSMGSLSLKDLYQTRADSRWRWGYTAAVRRSVLATDTNGVTYAYAIADVGVRVAKVTSLDKPLETVVFSAAKK